MGTVRTMSAEERRIHEVARRYEQRGYKVLVEPSPGKLPNFLKGFSPDIIAEGDDGSVVVQVKSRRNGERNDNWGELASIINGVPGWRLELVFSEKGVEVEGDSITESEIRARVDAGLQLARGGNTHAALVITWSAAEAAMRLAVERDEEIDLPDHRPATLVSRLYTEGYLEREEYELLVTSLDARNSIVHGLVTEPVSLKWIEKIRAVTLRLLDSRGE